MKIESITIRNFRSIKDVTIPLDDLTILIGPNGVGKTTVLEALSLFGDDGGRDVKVEDFYPESSEIEIILGVRTEGHPAFPPEFVIDGVCEMQKKIEVGSDNNITLINYSSKMCNRDFLGIRTKSAGYVRGEAKRLGEKYPDLPEYKNIDEWIAKFDEWEYKKSIDPKNKDDYVKDYVDGTQNKVDLKAIAVTYIPAMKDITVEGQESARSVLSELIEMTIRGAEQEDTKFAKVLNSHMRAELNYAKSLKTPLEKLSTELKNNAKRYMNEASFKICLEPTDYSPTRPNASIRLQDNEVLAPIERAGSGFQRVYLLSLLDTIAEMRKNSKPAVKGNKPVVDNEDQKPGLRLIIIDEPELYQHPQRQRRILKACIKLVEKLPICIVCSTHSPYFIELQKVDSLRLLQKDESARVLSTTMDKLKIHIIDKGDAEKARTWLDMNATHGVTEGFFSKLVVMVEGPGDRNMLLATAQAMGIDLDKYEISILSCEGKGKILKFAHIFRQFQIPVYPVWDLDHKPGKKTDEAKLKKNRRLAEFTDPQNDHHNSDIKKTEISLKFACFENNLTVSMIKDLDRCARELDKLEEYQKFQYAKKLDEQSVPTKNNNPEVSAKTREQNQDAHENQKHMLESKLAVYNMLKEVKRQNPRKLAAFTAVKVIRQLEKRGEALSK